ncbi:MAG: tRNA (adenosine(37)-N6)-threonylcarbamoyltransferase complex transferase subunit TsaD [Deltaproteobacteria bacterium]|nr:MAG: tRNA (adenosine(37)-N6)-threonylcarbamoyltransferase complex transferase subunit TsaD [Deltaproteobacteria bacterium]
MLILGIETSCDDTSTCLLNGEGEILAWNTFSQEEMLKKWGGIVPEIAARNHLAKLVPLLQEIFEKAEKSPKDLDLIGVTTHPGLLGPLLTGLNAAKTLALLYQVPIVPVNHLYAHLEVIHLQATIPYPYLGMVVSGGHSLFMKVTSPQDFEILGTTIDDAAGEAFDKGAKLLGLGYPGGKIIDDLAKTGDHKKYEFPIGLKSSGNANLSFSGLKTSLRNFLTDRENLDDIQDICASYQHAIVSALALKLRYALKQAGKMPIVVGGGVACNSYLRAVLKDKYDDVYFVSPQFCTDNGAMIANYARLTKDQAIPFPQCLALDAKGKIIAKGARN